MRLFGGLVVAVDDLAFSLLVGVAVEVEDGS
jgi:hypothetical protein